MKNIFQYFFVLLAIVCLTIIYNYLPNPIALLIWSFTGDGVLFVYCYGVLQILVYILILQCWKLFRIKTYWAIIMAIELPILLVLVPILITDPSFGSFLTAIGDYINYGTTSFIFVIFLLEVIGIVFYLTLLKVTSHSSPISSLHKKYIVSFDCLVFVGGIIYYWDNNYIRNTNTDDYMVTHDGIYYLHERRTDDSLYVEISDNNSFTNGFEFGACKADSFQNNILVQLFPKNVIVIDYPDSLISLNPSSKYIVFFDQEPSHDSFFSDDEQRYSCYYFWFSFSEKSRTVRYIETNKNNETIKMKEMRLRNIDHYQ